MELDHSARGTSTHILLDVAILLKLIDSMTARSWSVTTNSIFLHSFEDSINPLLNYMFLIKSCLSSSITIYIYLLQKTPIKKRRSMKYFKLKKLSFCSLVSGDPDVQIKRSFGFLFIAIAIAIIFAAGLSQFLSLDKVPYYYYPPLWLASFGASLGITLYKRRKMLAAVITRMKKILCCHHHIKIINGLSWAGPFAAISVFHQLYPYLILLGIGLGNMSTYFFIKTYSRNSNKEQLIVGLIAICSIPISIILDNTIFSASYELALLFSRFLIAISYGMGGVYALIARD
jgi:hypothetical protein